MLLPTEGNLSQGSHNIPLRLCLTHSRFFSTPHLLMIRRIPEEFRGYGSGEIPKKPYDRPAALTRRWSRALINPANNIKHLLGRLRLLAGLCFCLNLPWFGGFYATIAKRIRRRAANPLYLVQPQVVDPIYRNREVDRHEWI